jgi:hypothetical protein
MVRISKAEAQAFERIEMQRRGIRDAMAQTEKSAASLWDRVGRKYKLNRGSGWSCDWKKKTIFEIGKGESPKIV